ncbi:hypothetical protein H5410_035095 [Solanum commersonii]|uniref:Uncharacterized protein n=1 Tax=Solanum commersonii TaxID=4109 RepID=A0A9J5Y1X8_SOLCO|nr:hypothetical protein H5410_035095 [Solanum commersonii]
MNRYRTGTGWVDRNVDRYRDEPDRITDTVPSVPLYTDGTEADRNGTDGINGTTHLAILKND